MAKSHRYVLFFLSGLISGVGHPSSTVQRQKMPFLVPTLSNGAGFQDLIEKCVWWHVAIDPPFC